MAVHPNFGTIIFEDKRHTVHAGELQRRVIIEAVALVDKGRSPRTHNLGDSDVKPLIKLDTRQFPEVSEPAERTKHMHLDRVVNGWNRIGCDDNRFVGEVAEIIQYAGDVA